MIKFVYILFTMLFLHMDLIAQVHLKSVTIGEEWSEYATYHLEVEYYCKSELLLLKDNSLKERYPCPLKDSIDAVSFFKDLKALRHDSCMIDDSQVKDEVQIVLDTINGKKRITKGCFYVEFSNGEYACLWQKPEESVWFMYWNGKIFSVDQDSADDFRWKYGAINWKAVADIIRSWNNEDQ